MTVVTVVTVVSGDICTRDSGDSSDSGHYDTRDSGDSSDSGHYDTRDSGDSSDSGHYDNAIIYYDVMMMYSQELHLHLQRLIVLLKRSCCSPIASASTAAPRLRPPAVLVRAHNYAQWSRSRGEGVQAYGGSYSSVTSSGSIRYELGVMRFPCSHVMPGSRFWHHR